MMKKANPSPLRVPRQVPARPSIHRSTHPPTQSNHPQSDLTIHMHPPIHVHASLPLGRVEPRQVRPARATDQTVRYTLHVQRTPCLICALLRPVKNYGYHKAQHGRSEQVCTKKRPHAHDLTAGLMTVLCQHGFCLAFEVSATGHVHLLKFREFTVCLPRYEVLDETESVRHVFEFFYTRLRRGTRTHPPYWSDWRARTL